MHNVLLIHNNNVPSLLTFSHRIKFNIHDSNIDEYITNEIIPEIKNKQFDYICIKDTLSSSYLEFYGLRLAYHIRLSVELGGKRFIPILILSDLDSFLLNKLAPSANILFTKNVFVVKNNVDAVESVITNKILPINEPEYEKDFLNRIHVDAPKESQHDMANKWCIYRWADFLQINDSEKIKANRDEIGSKLYFKYLLEKYPIPPKKGIKFVPKVPDVNGKILYIDDEWNIGWEDIFIKYFSKVENISFQTLKTINKDTTFDDLKILVDEKIISYDPDLIILDMRLLVKDHKKDVKEKKLSGIKLLKHIKEILNPGIQVIMLTASGKSLILNEANKFGIVGYIKKEHPEDINSNTKDTFDLLRDYVNIGLNKKYLKSIWEIQQDILSLRLLDEKNYSPIEIEINSVFEILDSAMKRKNIYATLAIFKCIEIINNIFIDDKSNQWNDTGTRIHSIDGRKIDSSSNKIINILHKRLSVNRFDTTINDIVQKRNKATHSSKNIDIQESNILEWFEMLKEILKKLEKRS